MTAAIVFRGLRRGKARFCTAALGVAVAVFAFVFVFGLSAANRAQAPALARMAAAPWACWSFGDSPAPDADLTLPLVSSTIDYRPGGRVLQGPPMRAVVAAAPPGGTPWRCAPLEEGRWIDAAPGAGAEIVCTRSAMKRFGRGETPPLGSVVKFVGRASTMSATVVGYLREAKLPPGWPSVFANAAAFGQFAPERRGALSLWSKPLAGGGGRGGDGGEMLTAESDAVRAAFEGDENRRLDYARPLMFAAAVFTALSLLVNALLLSVEANRREVAVLRTVGLSRSGVIRIVSLEAALEVAAGWALGAVAALAALGLYVAADAAAFPAGMVPVSSLRPVIAKTAIASFAVAAAAVAFALKPALRVHPLEAAALRPRRPRRGMAVAFAFGFGAFVAVEVWGASLMMAFVPSPEWPDAIVSILPSGVDPCERPALDGIEGVRRISELYPLQLSFDPPVPVGRTPGGTGRGGRGGEERTVLRNALFLGAEWLPRFRFVEGDWESANEALFSGRACVVCSMLARARGLHKGDTLRVSSGGGRRSGGPGRVLELPVAAVVDLNWHMVTSRGLVRGLNGSPPMTDGVAFVSLATSCWLDPRPFLADVNITHLWVEYDKAFLAGNGVFGAGRIVESRIDERLGHPKHSTVRLHARDEIADGTLAHGSDVIGQAARVPFVFLSILSFGFVAMLVAAADARRDELATLRAIGATRAQLAWFLSRDALSCALRGMAAAVPLGALAGWLFTLKTGSIWPGLPHHFACPWRIVAEGALGAVAFVLAVAVPTSLRIVSRARLSGSGR